MSEIKNWLRHKLPLIFDKENIVEAVTIPVFPLKTVLFPGSLLPLRIFEPRYMDMTKSCLREDKPFGVCLIREGEEVGAPAIPEQIGCLAKITDWDMQQQGILNIQVHGLQRFTIQTLQHDDNGLIMATIFNVPAEPPQPVPESLQSCVAVLRRIVQEVGEDRFQAPLKYDDAAWVGYRLAEMLPIKLSARQDMLEMNDSITRLQILSSFLKKQGLSA